MLRNRKAPGLKSTLRGMLSGAIAGGGAAIPMLVVMEAGFRRLPARERYPLPPREVVEEVSEQTGVPLPAGEEYRIAVTLAAHLGYGMAVGAPIGLASPRTGSEAVFRGLLLGGVVWTGSYLGLLPALGILRPATEHPPRRTLLMIAAHGVWGVCAALIVSSLRFRS